ncbi:MAG: universal stress protein [Chloroflexi bacterium]|nr:universal stress protein [Chloroflexota bacterium]
MHHITILSEDRVFSTLLVRNLQAQGYSVDIHLLNLQLPLSFLASPSTWDTSLWVLDLNWFNDPWARTYPALAEWSTTLPQPAVLLVDTSWDAELLKSFRAAAILTKPFSIVSFLQVVKRLKSEGWMTPHQRSQGDLEMELKERSSLIFKEWTPTYHRIIVPLDGSRLAESILPVVATIASALSLEVMLFHVVPAEGQPARAPTPSQRKAMESIGEYLEGLAMQLKTHGVMAGWRVACGPPVEDIVRYASEAPADLIAMSTHGMGANSRMPMGSIAAAVLEQQTRPVLLIKPDQEIAQL